jgi:dihydroorotase
MLAAGFLPDVISSDIHALSINGPAYDQITTMSKLLSLGMDLTAVIRAGTCAPAAAVGRDDLGHLGVGSVGDASIIDLTEGAFDYRDVLGETRHGRQRLSASGLVISGKWWHPA